MSDAPLRFILDSPAWQRGYQAALDAADWKPTSEIVNPYDLDWQEFFGFEEGRVQAEILQRAKEPK